MPHTGTGVGHVISQVLGSVGGYMGSHKYLIGCAHAADPYSPPPYSPNTNIEKNLITQIPRLFLILWWPDSSDSDLKEPVCLNLRMICFEICHSGPDTSDSLFLISLICSKEPFRTIGYQSHHQVRHPGLPSTRKDAHRKMSMKVLWVLEKLWHERQMMAQVV